jgi:predicted permease
MEAHIEEKAAELQADGWSERDALAAARRRFGNFGVKQEESREVWIARWWRDFRPDLRYGAHTLRSQPGFALAAVAALVLGIAVNAVLFNVFNALALAPWGVRDAKQTVQILADRGLGDKGRWSGFSWPHFRYLQANTRSLSGLTAFTNVQVRVGRGDGAWTAQAVTASENFFDLLGTGFAAGRGFSMEPRHAGDPAPEVVLHYDTWMTRFGGDTAVVGKWIELGGRQLQVVGVAAPGFSGPSPTKPNLWVPEGWGDIFNPSFDTFENADACCVSVVGRLKPATKRAGAEAELSTLSAQFEVSQGREKRGVLVTGPSFFANPSLFAQAWPVFIALGVASLLILLLACANVANLQLARGVARRREIAVRLSLGASRGRIVRQLLAESLVLSGIAGAVSAALSMWAPNWIVAAATDSSEALAVRFDNDARVVLFIFAATVLAALLFGLAPALGTVRDGMTPGLREGGRTTSRGRARSILLGAQVALCAILISGTALLVRALDRVRHLDTGFRYENVLLMPTGLDSSGATDEQSRAVLTQLVDLAKGLGGVESVAHAVVIPYGDTFTATSLIHPRTGAQSITGYNLVSANYFETLQAPLVAGRPFSPADEVRGDVAIINEAAAQWLWPGETAVGRTFAVDRQVQVIGVARNFGTRSFGSEKEPYVWFPSRGARGSQLLIRHSGAEGPLLRELPKRARELDKRVLASAEPYAETIARERRSADVAALVAGVLGALSLVLACVGVYGVAAYNVSQRTREVGVRMALGASRGAILAIVLRDNMRSVLAGVLAGTAGAVGFGQMLTSMLYGVKPYDPPALAVALAILFATAGLATWGPARRASRVDPAITLRYE